MSSIAITPREEVLEAERKKERATLTAMALATSGVALLIFGMCVWLLSSNTWDLDDWRHIIVASFADASATTGLFGAFYTVLTRVNFNREVEHALVSVLSARPELFRSFSTATRNKFVSGSLQSALTEEIGDIVFKDIVSPYLTANVHLRESYDYAIEIQEDTPSFEPVARPNVSAALESMLAHKEQYLWVQQDVCNSVFIRGLQNQRLQQFEICFALDALALEALLAHGEVFFREIIEFDRDTITLIDKFDEADATEFVRRILMFRVATSTSNSELQFRVNLKKVLKDKTYLSVMVENFVPTDQEPTIRINFTNPQFRETPSFIVSFPQPCKDPEVRFRRNSRMTGLEPVFFLSNFREGNVNLREMPYESKDPQSYTVKVQGWLFPRSGIMFRWRYKT